MLKQKTLLYFIFNIVNSILGLATISIVARYMGPEPMGIVASVLAFISLFNIFGDFGFGLAHYKRVSEGKDLGKCIGTYASVNIILSALIMLVIVVVFFGSKYFSNSPYISEKNEPIFYILLISTFVGNILKVVSVTFAARLEVAKETIIGFVTKFALSAGKIFVALMGFSVIYLAGANLFSVIIGAIISIFFFWKYPISLPDWAMFRSYLKFAIPVALMGVTNLYINLDKVFIAKYVNDKEVAYYTAAFGIVNLFYFFGDIFINILFPTFSKKHAKNEIDSIGKLAAKTERYISLIITPMIIFVAAFSDPIRLLILGSEFEPSSLIISILAINVLVVILSRPYSIQTMSTNRVNIALYYQIIIGGLNIIINLILIPKMLFGIKLFGLGSIGAAIALLIANLIGMTLFRIKANKISGKGINFKIFIHIILAVIVFYFVYFVLKENFQLNILTLLVAALVGEIVYLISLKVLRELKKQDLIFLLDFVNVKKMKRYIVNEVQEKQPE